jgi:hypothetical protein
VLLDVGDELLVLLRRPRPPLQPGLVTARRAPHLWSSIDPRTLPDQPDRVERQAEKGLVCLTAVAVRASYRGTDGWRCVN